PERLLQRPEHLRPAQAQVDRLSAGVLVLCGPPPDLVPEDGLAASGEVVGPCDAAVERYPDARLPHLCGIEEDLRRAPASACRPPVPDGNEDVTAGDDVLARRLVSRLGSLRHPRAAELCERART